ncbi:hypothetical protein DMA11_21515 [Marinilabiliaceae bacterium JC017]|nr:hypothetical protein DMA11_21515 [Marinilabiliaceae bacterium JC017]
MAGKPIATVGSMHVCPMCSGVVPHVGGPVAGPGASNVLINGKPVAVMGDMCTCAGPPSTIVQGEPSILINGAPVATTGSMTSHGGSITMGESNVLVSSATPSVKAVMPVKRIPFPKINIIKKVQASVVGQGKNMNKAETNIAQIKQEAESEEGEPNIYNLQWLKEKKVVRDSKVIKQVTLSAHVMNISDGATITLKVKPPAKESQSEATDGSEQVVELSGTVKDKKVEVVWEVEDASASENESSTQNA